MTSTILPPISSNAGSPGIRPQCACGRRFFARLASEIFFSNLLRGRTLGRLDLERREGVGPSVDNERVHDIRALAALRPLAMLPQRRQRSVHLGPEVGAKRLDRDVGLGGGLVAGLQTPWP